MHVPMGKATEATKAFGKGLYVSSLCSGTAPRNHHLGATEDRTQSEASGRWKSTPQRLTLSLRKYMSIGCDRASYTEGLTEVK